MRKKQRKTLLFALAAIFIITAPLTAFYSLGWRFDIKTGRINQPGIFYFKTNPKNAQVFLDGKLKKRTDFFFGTLLVENLSSKKYDVSIKKEDYFDWQKELEIKNGEATEAKNITLIPKNAQFPVISKNIDKLFFSPDGKGIILKEKSQNTWSLKLYETDKSLKSHVINEKDLLSKIGLAGNMEVEDISFSSELKTILLKTKVNSITAYYILDGNALTYLAFGEDIKKADFDPSNNRRIIFLLNNGGFMQLDALGGKITSTFPKNVINYSIFKNEIFCLDPEGNIIKTDFSFNLYEKLDIPKITINNSYDYELSASSSSLIIKENNTLYYINRDKNTIKKISEQANGFEFSSDFKKIFYYNNYEIFVLFLEKEDSQPQKEAGDQIFLTRFSEEIGKVFWYTNYYLVFNVKDKIKVIETDDRGKMNIVDLKEFKNPEIFWNDLEKKLYIFSENNLFSSDRLIQ